MQGSARVCTDRTAARRRRVGFKRGRPPQCRPVVVQGQGAVGQTLGAVLLGRWMNVAALLLIQSNYPIRLHYIFNVLRLLHGRSPGNCWEPKLPIKRKQSFSQVGFVNKFVLLFSTVRLF